MNLKNSKYYFLSGGGEMGEQVRAKDWSKTTLGDPENWPQSLRTMVAVMLNNPYGMYIAWGNEYIQLYNDAYRPILGSTKHPKALGISTRETFIEIWDIIGTMFDNVMKGEAVGFPDFMLPLDRNGYVEECYFDFSYTPIRKENGEVGGVLVTVIETTNKKTAEDALKESEAKFRAMADNIPNLAWMADAEGWIYWYNRKWYEYTGTEPEQMKGWGWQSVHHPDELSRVLDKWQNSIKTGLPFEMVFPLKAADGKFRQFLTRVLPQKNREGKIHQWFGTNTDITDQKIIEEALKNSEQRFRNTVKQAPIGITILKGPEYIVEIANDAYLLVVDKKEETFVGRPLFDSLPEVKETVGELLNNVLTTGIPFHGIEYPIPVNRFGKYEVSYFNFMYYPLKDDKGDITGIIVTATDVSESVAAKHFITESEKQFRNMVMDSPIPMAIFKGPDHIIEMANNTMLNKIWRRKESDVIGNKLLEVFPELIEQKYAGLLNEVYTTGKVQSGFESPGFIKGDDGLIMFYFDFEYSPLFDLNGQVSAIMITVNDVTEKVETRRKIEESEERFRSIAETLPQLIWETDEKGNSLFASGRWKEYTGITPKGEEEWKAVIHPDDLESNTKIWMDSLTTGNVYKCDVRLRNKHGEYRWHTVTGEAVYDKEKIIKWVGAFTDVHFEKGFTQELEKQVENRTNELKETNKTLEQKYQELENMNTELQSFAYISSHDLQEPLRKIQTFSSQILDKEYENLTESGKDKFQRMQNAAKRMQALIEDLLAYSRTSTAERKFEHTNLGLIIKEVKDDLKEELQQKNVTINEIGNCEVSIIPFQFRQLIYNLISNSIKFSNINVDPNIIIKCEVDKAVSFKNPKLDTDLTYCHISISDNGIGFEPKYSEKIFEVFQRLHGKSQYAGTGIGLAIVKKIVENHNGIISASGEVNKGAIFDIYIPV